MQKSNHYLIISQILDIFPNDKNWQIGTLQQTF